MAYGLIANVPAPIEMYDAVNAQINEQIGDTQPAGLAVHITRRTPEGFQVIEVWESKQQADEFADAVLGPVIDKVSQGQAPRREDVEEGFEVHNFFTGPAVSSISAR